MSPKIPNRQSTEACWPAGRFPRVVKVHRTLHATMRDLINIGAMIGPRMFASGAGLRSYANRPGVTDPIAEAGLVEGQRAKLVRG